mmetsp:Transcript_31939/g.75873  ORF Transcript_31939/g.75873 Transcript_31939/m.75873 type:complete len:400 (+) Transcript_31939:1460-2659(+)
MERLCELALNVKPDVDNGTIDCAAMGYEADASGRVVPVSPQAIALAGLGQYSIACRVHEDRLWDMLSAYGNEMFIFLALLNLVGLTLYFVTSSDSGSMINDLLSSGGHYGSPPLQKIYWAFTEGALATALLAGGGPKAVGALQAVSIIAGFPYTLLICLMCTALYRLVLWDQKDPEMLSKTRFITGLFDFSEGFMPTDALEGGPGVSERATSLAICIFFPFVGLHAMHQKLYGSTMAMVHTGGQAAFLAIWLGCLIGETSSPYSSYIGWCFYISFAVWETVVLMEARARYNVWGISIEDFFKCMTMPMFVASQLELQAKYVDLYEASEPTAEEVPKGTSTHSEPVYFQQPYVLPTQQNFVFAQGGPTQQQQGSQQPMMYAPQQNFEQQPQQVYMSQPQM